MEASLQLSVIDSLKIWLLQGPEWNSFVLVQKVPPVKYLQLIMLQLLVFPFSLPSSQMIFFFKSQFLKIIFSMLKKYGKAIEQPQGTLPLHLHSEQMDGQSTESRRRWARSLVLDCPLPYLLQGWVAFIAPTAISLNWIPPPTSPHPWNVSC